MSFLDDENYDEPFGGPHGGNEEWGWPAVDPEAMADSDEFTPSIEDLITNLEVPISKPQPPVGEILEDLIKRAEIMAVEDPKSLSRGKIRRNPALFLEYAHIHDDDSYVAYNSNAFEDIHYDVYRKIKARAQTRFVSVTINDILQAVPETIPEIVRLQATQTLDAYSHLIDLGINHNELTRTLNDGDQNDKFAMRSFSRLMLEKVMGEHAAKLSAEGKNRQSSNRISFQEAALGGMKKITRIYRSHVTLLQRMGSLSTDGKQEVLLEWRDIKRAASFARPLIYLADKSAIE